MDLGIAMGSAVAAARRGDLEALEIELSNLRRLQTDNVITLGARLRTMARCVRSHPSFARASAAAAG